MGKKIALRLDIWAFEILYLPPESKRESTARVTDILDNGSRLPVAMYHEDGSDTKNLVNMPNLPRCPGR